VEDLPFRLEDMPSNYGGFREAVKGLEVRKVLEAPEEVKCVPMKNVLEPGDIPTLSELGLTTPPAMAQVSRPLDILIRFYPVVHLRFRSFAKFRILTIKYKLTLYYFSVNCKARSGWKLLIIACFQVVPLII
jgi:hypothetical protein